MTASPQLGTGILEAMKRIIPVLYGATMASTLGGIIVCHLVSSQNPHPTLVRNDRETQDQATAVQQTYAATQTTIVHGSQSTFVNGNHTMPLHILKEKLQILPITCHPGSEGLFPRKYDKLLQTLAEYAVFHNASRTARPLIYTCGPGVTCGGLGDRLRGIVYTLLLAVFSGRRLLLHWGMPNGENVYLKPNLINWVPEKSDTENMMVLSVLNTTSSLDSAMKTIGKNTSVNVALNTGLELELIKAPKFKPQWLIDGLKRTGLVVLTNSEINAIFGIAFRYLFGFTSDVFQAVNKAKLLLGLDTQKYVAVHIRSCFAGSNFDNSPHAKCIRKKEQWEQMLQCAASVANTSTGSNSSIFLATDSNLVKDLATKMSGVRYRTLDVVLTHVDRVNKKRGPTEAESKGLLSVWVDFLELAQSYIQVRGGSDWIRGSGFDLGSGHLCGLPKNQTFNGLKNCANEVHQ